MSLEAWQKRLADGRAALGDARDKMRKREQMYAGTRELEPLTARDRTRTGQPLRAVHVRNIAAELIEAQVDSNVPAPKVTARRRQDEDLAQTVEAFLRNEMDRLPMERVNDLMERMVPMQGGAAFLVEWDSGEGSVTVRALHPRQLIPQPGIYTGMADMDWIIVSVPSTRGEIERKYKKDIGEIGGAEQDDIDPGRGDGDQGEAVTLYIGYERRPDGIARAVWTGDTLLEDLLQYQRRRRQVCARCGRPRPAPGETVEEDAGTTDGIGLEGLLLALTGMPTDEDGTDSGTRTEAGRRYEGGGCPYCGGETWRSEPRDRETLAAPVLRTDGEIIPAGTDIPAYTPDCYPVILQRSISAPGQLFGTSDLDLIADQQRTANRIESKIIDKLLKSGSYITLPDDAAIRVDTEDMKVIRPGSHQNKELIGVYDLQGNIQQDMAYLAQVYEEARQVVGITDSFQGRRDSTATSAVAKEFSAAQAAGRMASKRVMKQAAYADLFQTIFRFYLAYAEGPRPIQREDNRGNAVYCEFNRYDFLERDTAGGWRWNDSFLFSCDASAPLANNREALWQETRLNLQTGAFGNPAELETLILFWTKMQELHYPLAASTLASLKERMETQQAMAQAQMAQQDMAAGGGQTALTGGAAPVMGAWSVPGGLAAGAELEGR